MPRKRKDAETKPQNEPPTQAQGDAQPTPTYTFPQPRELASPEEQARILRNCYRLIRQWAAEERAREASQADAPPEQSVEEVMEKFGFKKVGTGGGCTAYEKQGPRDLHWMIVVEEGGETPTEPEQAVRCGLLDHEENEIASLRTTFVMVLTGVVEFEFPAQIGGVALKDA